jgi:GT2 family glycosyltransferase
MSSTTVQPDVYDLDPHVWFSAAKLVDGQVVLYPPLKEEPDKTEETRLLMVPSQGPLFWQTYAPGLFDREDVAASLRTRATDMVLEVRENKALSDDAEIIICTRNRPDLLRQALGSLEGASCPVLVVDNAPSDSRTQLVVAEIARQGRAVRRVVEPLPGLSRARNRGLLESTAEIVVFTDDDALVDNDWLSALLQPFDNEDVGIVTGLVAPAELVSRPQAMFESKLHWSTNLAPALFSIARASEFDFPIPYSAGRYGTGASFAIRRELAVDLGGFDVRLGAGTRTAGGEDMEMFVRVLRAGKAIAYEPHAISWHKHRQTHIETRRHLYGYGKGLSASFMVHLTRDRFSRVARQGMSGFRSLSSDRAREVTEGAPRSYLMWELAGMVVGPFAFLVEAASTRRTREALSQGGAA